MPLNNIEDFHLFTLRRKKLKLLKKISNNIMRMISLFLFLLFVSFNEKISNNFIKDIGFKIVFFVGKKKSFFFSIS